MPDKFDLKLAGDVSTGAMKQATLLYVAALERRARELQEELERTQDVLGWIRAQFGEEELSAFAIASVKPPPVPTVPTQVEERFPEDESEPTFYTMRDPFSHGGARRLYFGKDVYTGFHDGEYFVDGIEATPPMPAPQDTPPDEDTIGEQRSLKSITDAVDEQEKRA